MCAKVIKKRGRKVHYRYIENKAEKKESDDDDGGQTIDQTQSTDLSSPSSKQGSETGTRSSPSIEPTSVAFPQRGSACLVEVDGSWMDGVVTRVHKPKTMYAVQIEPSKNDDDDDDDAVCQVCVSRKRLRPIASDDNDAFLPTKGTTVDVYDCNRDIWIQGVVSDARETDVAYTVFLQGRSPLQRVPRSRIRAPDDDSVSRSTQFAPTTMLSDQLPIVSTSFGDALLYETHPDGFCTVVANPLVASSTKSERGAWMKAIDDVLSTNDVEKLKTHIARARRLAGQTLLAHGGRIRVMRHLVRWKTPLDPPLPKIKARSDTESFSLLGMDKDLTKRHAYEIELHGHNFFFSRYEGGREYKVKIEIHEQAEVGHLFAAISEKLNVPEEYLVVEKFWRKDLDKAKKDTYEYLQMKAFGRLMDAPRDQRLFETRQVREGRSRTGQDVQWFNRRDEVLVEDKRPEAFRKQIGAVTQFTKAPDHVLRSERFRLGR